MDASSYSMMHFLRYLGGLQPPYLWQKQQFKEVQGQFVHILNAYKSRWICVSNTGCEANTINVYDSA